MYYILDSHTNTFLNRLGCKGYRTYKTRTLANRTADRWNKAYGSSRYYTVFSLNEPRTYNMQEDLLGLRREIQRAL